MVSRITKNCLIWYYKYRKYQTWIRLKTVVQWFTPKNTCLNACRNPGPQPPIGSRSVSWALDYPEPLSFDSNQPWSHLLNLIWNPKNGSKIQLEVSDVSFGIKTDIEKPNGNKEKVRLITFFLMVMIPVQSNQLFDTWTHPIPRHPLTNQKYFRFVWSLPGDAGGLFTPPPPWGAGTGLGEKRFLRWSNHKLQFNSWFTEYQHVTLIMFAQC